MTADPTPGGRTGGPTPARSVEACTLLLVDDEAPNLELIEELLAPEGFRALVRTTDPRDAAPLFETHAPDLVLLDLHMPHLSGFDVLRELGARVRPGDFVPVLVLTADASRTTRARALSEGAHDFLTKPLDALEVRLRVRNLLKTRLLHLEQRDAREAAEAATAAHERVLSVVAHDLRNPLAAIAMDAEMVREQLSAEDHPAQRRAAARIERTAHRMHDLIEDLLEVSRLDGATLRIRAEPVAPERVFTEALSLLEPLARRRGVRLDFRGQEGLAGISWDAPRMVQVLSNLVGNALEFTPAGGEVRVEWEAGEDALSVRIADSGVGIPAEELPHVFGAFWQGGSGARRGGVGLGLAISRAIVEAHGGTIEIDSTVGVGTTVSLRLPLSPPGPSEATVNVGGGG